MRKVYIIGNGKILEDLSNDINNADLVYRFNNLNNYNDYSGTKIDYWVLASHPVLLNKLIDTPYIIKQENYIKITDIIKASKK